MRFNSFSMIELKIRLIKDIIAKKRKIKEVVEILKVDRRSVSRWKYQFIHGGEEALLPKKPGPKNGTAWNKTGEEIEDIICQIAEDNPFKGPDWIRDKLLDISIDQSTVYRILKRKGVRYYYNYQHKRRKKKRYCLSWPGQEIQLDTCYPFGYQRKAIVYDAIDDCSRWVFAKVLSGKTQKDTISFLKELIEQAPFRIQSIRTDCGTEFGKEVDKFLGKQGIKLIKNPPYTPQHNGKIERYHRTFKENEACFWKFNAPISELNYYLKLWIDYYNNHKKHTGLKMNKMTPIQKIAYVMVNDSFFQDKNGTLILQQNKT